MPAYSEDLQQVIELPESQHEKWHFLDFRQKMTDPCMSPTTVTGAERCTTLDSRIKSSFTFSHTSFTAGSASSCFLHRRSMHESTSKDDIR